MSVLGEAGGFEVEVMAYGNVMVYCKPGSSGDIVPFQARALAALLVTAADEAERGKWEPERTGGLDVRFNDGAVVALGPESWATVPYKVDLDYKPDTEVLTGAGAQCWLTLSGPNRIQRANGLTVPDEAVEIQCIDGKARALDADGKIIASNVPGDPGVEKGGE